MQHNKKWQIPRSLHNANKCLVAPISNSEHKFSTCNIYNIYTYLYIHFPFSIHTHMHTHTHTFKMSVCQVKKKGCSSWQLV